MSCLRENDWWPRPPPGHKVDRLVRNCLSVRFGPCASAWCVVRERWRGWLARSRRLLDWMGNGVWTMLFGWLRASVPDGVAGEEAHDERHDRDDDHNPPGGLDVDHSSFQVSAFTAHICAVWASMIAIPNSLVFSAVLAVPRSSFRM